MDTQLLYSVGEGILVMAIGMHGVKSTSKITSDPGTTYPEDSSGVLRTLSLTHEIWCNTVAGNSY